ncbi:MAG: hypothetical protein WDA15_11460, partial [Trueperaceae bacterium]
VAASQPTVMAMLECHEPSPVALRVLDRVANGYMTLEEAAAPEAMRRLANPLPGDPPVVAGESGGVGFAGLLEVMRDPELAASIGLGPNARVLVIITEGATDPGLYRELVGMDAGQIRG